MHWLKLDEDTYFDLASTALIRFFAATEDKPAEAWAWTPASQEIQVHIKSVGPLDALRARLNRLSDEQSVADYHHRAEWWHPQNQASK